MDVRRADDGLFLGEEAVDLAKRALAGGVLLREGGVAWINATNVLLGAGDIGRVRDLYDEAIIEARRQGDLFNVGALLGFRGLAGVMAGDLLDAETDLREALGLSEAIGLRAGLPYQAALLAEVLAESGKLEEADAALSLIPLEPQGVVSSHFAFLLKSKGILLLARGRPEDALAEFTRIGASIAAFEAEQPGFMPWRSHAASALTPLAGRKRLGASRAREWSLLDGGEPHMRSGWRFAQPGLQREAMRAKRCFRRPSPYWRTLPRALSTRRRWWNTAPPFAAPIAAPTLDSRFERDSSSRLNAGRLRSRNVPRPSFSRPARAGCGAGLSPASNR
jgi:tetratricopeptide (TPR) repeat protein